MFGSQTAAFCVAGTSPPPATTDSVESYDGSSWTETTDINTARKELKGFGVTTAGVVAGGRPEGTHSLTESWNGTAWTEVGDLTTARRKMGVGGVSPSTAGIVFGGAEPATATTETWNGTAWTDVGDLGTARYVLGGAGTSTAALAMGGFTGPAASADSEEWNGTAWTELNNLPFALYNFAGAGTQTSAIAAGGVGTGQTPATASTTTYDGTDWSTQADMNTTAREGDGGCGADAVLSLYTGGAPEKADTEEWSGEPVAASTVTSS